MWTKPEPRTKNKLYERKTKNKTVESYQDRDQDIRDETDDAIR